ncbi:hypothetical protein NE237_024757 [Protea cynaroides]|uniref:Non-haem dioxygenase N-terminal domain-containing protein n=1 Tax=Protea cynaroides TaxID=273540 RepID=A0A9Q0JZH8_9MAGN|nr:hypothetical protein NE237_024757 [Protea cynaroides]
MTFWEQFVVRHRFDGVYDGEEEVEKGSVFSVLGPTLSGDLLSPCYELDNQGYEWASFHSRLARFKNHNLNGGNSVVFFFHSYFFSRVPIILNLDGERGGDYGKSEGGGGSRPFDREIFPAWAKDVDQCLKKYEGACKDWGFFQVINHGVPTICSRGLRQQQRSSSICLWKRSAR